MKDLFGRYKSVIRFVVLFLGTYLLLTFLYSWYLHSAKAAIHAPDFITQLVAQQSSEVLIGLGYDAKIVPEEAQPTMKLFVNDLYLARIIEGCNSISIIILFIAFVVAFAQRPKKTLLFIFGGTVLIYGINIIRIAVLAVALYKYPNYEEVLHGVVFPGIIYGMVFLLWMIWVRGLKQKKEPNHG